MTQNNKKTNKTGVLLLIFTLIILLSACVGDDEFGLPEIEVNPVNMTGTEVSIDAIRDALLQEMANNGNPTLTFETDIYVTGYVVSSDEYGNFFKEMIIQDTSSNANAGLKILVDANPLFQNYEFGRRIFVGLRGLSASMNNGQLTVGIKSGNTIDRIPESRQFDYVFRDTTVADIEASVRNISDLDQDLINTFVKLSDVQFNRDHVLGDNPQTYAGEPEDEFDGERILESCSENYSIILSTSTFADFKSVPLPNGRGSVKGVFTYDFFGEEFNMVINDLNGIMFEDKNRCDPPEVDCGIATSSGNDILFSEFFETQTEGQPITGNGWTNYVEAGTETWEAYFDDGANASLGISARMGSFESGDKSSVGWLITPEIDFNNQQDESLSFKTSNSFSDGSTLEVMISQDWDGDPETVPAATWALLPSAIVVADDDYFGDWIFSGLVDLSCIEGTAHIAWRYSGSGDKDSDGTYELDEIEIRSN